MNAAAMKLLIVEDDADFAAALSRAMQKRGAEVALAHDSLEAHAVAERFVPLDWAEDYTSLRMDENTIDQAVLQAEADK